MRKNLIIVCVIALLLPISVKADDCDKYKANATAYQECIKAKNRESGNGDKNAATKAPDNVTNGASGGGGGTGDARSNDTGTGGGGTATSQQKIGANTTSATANAKEELSDTTCDSLFGGNLGKLIKQAYGLIKFAVPILLLVLSIKDYGEAIIQDDTDKLKKSTTVFIKRLIIAVVILVLPTIIGFILELMGIEKCLPI